MMETLKAADLCAPPLNTSCRPLPSTTRTNILKTLTCSISVLTVMLNSLVIISISHFRQLQTPTNLILLSLAVSDLMVGLAAMPITTIIFLSCGLVDKLTCAFSFVLGFILTSASVGSMVLISVDRYVAVCYPLRYSSMITPCRVKICVSLCWFCSVLYSFIVLKDFLSYVYLSNSCFNECVLIIDFISGAVDLVLTFLSPVTVIIVLYMRVFVVAVSQARVMRSQVQSVRSNTVTAKRSEMRAARTLGIVLLFFIICLCPYFSPSMAGKDTISSIGLSAQIGLFYCNSTFNPLIYAFFYPWFRKSVKLIVSLQILQPSSCDTKIM